MKKLFQIIVSIPFIFLGCNDSSNEPQLDEKDYVKGDVSFGLKNTVSFEEMLDTVFSFGEIYQIVFNTAKYSTKFPKDSLEYIKSNIAQYDFIDTSLTLIKYEDNQNQWLFYLWIRGFNETNVSDWYTLRNQFDMLPIQTYSLYGLLKVEEGKESYWINQLKGTGLFEWVDYNYIANIIGH